MKTPHLLIICILWTLIGMCWGAVITLSIQNNARTASESATTYKVCNTERLSHTHDLSGCYALQEAFHNEFLCAPVGAGQTNNNNPATHCWVEKTK